MNKTKQNKYWVTVTHETDSNYSFTAASEEDAKAIAQKMLEHGVFTDAGVDWHELDSLKEDDPFLLRSELVDEGNTGERREEFTVSKSA